ncbi:hypothetical protein [Lacinutrix sp.]|uniref:hypothetical protein n=1 Tax=Lacinutrix sp. TaxID=1937692 RepID=UPI0025BCEF50|nr:hypothetical protein [Lacinutrix sp.]
MNNDKQWLKHFHNLKLGWNLPGGGMGSINDWSPSYDNEIEYAWFNLLYRITYRLLTEKLEPEFIKKDYSIEHRNEVSILQCSNCNQKFQHPRIFEDHIATFFYLKNFSKFLEKEMLKDFTNPNFSYKNFEAIELRDSLKYEYEKNEIILFDFQKHKRICPKYDTKIQIEHIDYEIIKKENKLGLKR